MAQRDVLGAHRMAEINGKFFYRYHLKAARGDIADKVALATARHINRRRVRHPLPISPPAAAHASQRLLEHDQDHPI